eukprot:TRINITY_DN4604_c0_g1_i1.p1 TRINITY_DN4604_c0_g1~~TRINITY_DN4604_c0_g1_i1.p1  ORF type:complete len:119 (-),score=31.55 TRINITY_DN4604_c0_g1_i1:269-625(-)
MGIVDYLVPFISGGVTVVGVKIVGNHMSPQLAAVIGAFPLGMISSSTITNVNKFGLYLHNYPVMLAILLVAMGVYRYSFEKLGIARDLSMKRALGVWAALAVIASKTIMRGSVPGAKP